MTKISSKFIAVALSATAPFAFAKADLKQAAEANNRFGWQLFQKVVAEEAAKKQDTNILISSLSASVALAMAQAGATGQTRDEMIKAIGFTGTGDELNESIHALAKNILGRQSEETAHLANLVLGNRDNFDITPAFSSTVDKYYNFNNADEPPVWSLPFSDASTLDKVNQWCSDNTDGMIDSILKRLDPDMVAVLLNALLFEGKWQVQFNKNATYETKNVTKPANVSHKFRSWGFEAPSGKNVDVAMMATDEGNFETADAGTFQLVSMPFCAKSREVTSAGQPQTVCDSKGDYALDLLVPAKGKNAYELVAQVDLKQYTDAVAKLQGGTSGLHVPKFNFEYEEDAPKSIKPFLESLGMVRAFQSHPGHFSLLGVEKSEANIYIGDVVQKTSVQMEEGGFKAAAVTAVVFRRESAVAAPPVFVDKAFVFVLRDTKTQSLLFQGVAAAPQWTEPEED